jgi:hypothetical protein
MTSRTSARWAVSVVALFAATGAARDGHAQQPTPVSNEMRAEQLFQLAEKKFDSGRFNEACADWSESLRLGPKLGTLLNLALCHETVGKSATAWAEFHHATAWAAQNNQKDRHEYATSHITGLEPRLPRVLLQIPVGSPIATVDVDGEPLPDSRWYLPMFLDPGDHSVALTAPGKKRGSVTFRVVQSPTDQLVNIPPLVDDDGRAGPMPNAPPAIDTGRTKRLAGWIALGGGAATLAVGATFGILAISARDAAGTHCAGKYCDPDGAPHYQEAQDRAAVSSVALGVGVLAVAAGAYLLITAPKAPPTTAITPFGLRTTF